MSLVDIDSWLTEYESCEKLSHTILAEIARREQNRPQGYTELTRKITVFLEQFEKELQQLKQKLDSSSRNRSITFEETERRQRLIEILQSKLQQSRSKFTSSTRSDLLPSSSGSFWQGDDVPIIDTNNGTQTVEQLKQRQIQIMEDQNRGLDALSKSIARQKELASMLGQEVDEHNVILDNLTDSMDRVDNRVHAETSNIGLVSQADSTWGYWMVILGLFVAIVIVWII
ncbi:syntaxin-8 [Episyrphus balteatus]|uniref:syntaxin-8 n=1 Tax=Episyrphus balteatus TaxID=286459 RepID=UPI002485A8C4|nr:syntaxin-8 [Episyrphus balteatus]